MIKFFLILALAPIVCFADQIVVTRVIKPSELIGADDLRIIKSDDDPRSLKANDFIGMEARRTLFPKRLLKLEDVGTPALVDRNQIVELVYLGANIEILAEGRALGRGGYRETLRVMNLASKSIVVGSVGKHGRVFVGGGS